MLIPKRVKRRKQHRGVLKGAAHKGNFVAYGEYGLVAEEAGWIKSNQIEAARIAMTDSSSAAVKSGSISSPTSPSPATLRKPVWVPVKVTWNSGSRSSSRAESCSRWQASARISHARQCVLQVISFPSSASSSRKRTWSTTGTAQIRQKAVRSDESERITQFDRR